AWLLRRPWTADKNIGPTYNAFINGSGYWARYGAADTTLDRFPAPLGRQELSATHPTASFDLGPILSNPTYGRTLAARARVLAENGFLLQKVELYDFRYRDWSDPYEWAVATGGHALKLKNSRLVLTFHRARSRQASSKAEPVSLTDIAALAARLKD